MAQFPRRTRALARRLGQILALFALYVAAGWLCSTFAPPSGANAQLLWAPSGIALAALAIGDLRLWPGVAAGAFVLGLRGGMPWPGAIGIAAGSTLEAVTGALILRTAPDFRGSLDRLVEVLKVALAAAASAILAAAIGTISLVAWRVIPAAAVAHILPLWWAGDFLGAILVTPLLLTWTRGAALAPRRWMTAEAWAMGMTLGGVALFVSLAPRPYSQPILLLFPLMWAALRFGPRGAASGMIVVTAAAVVATVIGRGTFAPIGDTENLIELTVFLGATSLAGLALAAVVAELSLAREQHAESEARLRTVMDGTSDVIWVKDQQGRFEMMNAAGHRVLGAPPGAVVGTTSTDWLSKEEAERSWGADRAVLDRGENASLDVSVVVDGEVRELQIHKAPYRDHTGRVTGVISVGRDITERRAVERELGASEERMRLAVEAAGLGVWSWEPRGDRLVWSPLCRAMHGVGPDEEISYARLLGSLHADDREATARAVREALAQRTEYRVEHRVVRPDGSVRWHHALGRVYRDEGHEVDRMLGVVMDITPQKEAAEERARLLEAERAARADAEAATRAKDDFLAVLSHELRTPLQSMAGWTHILQGPNVDAAKIRRGLDTIARNVKTQAQLIEDLLDVSRIVAGKLSLSLARVDLREVVAAAIDSVRSQATAKAVELEAALSPLSGDVMGDAGRLQQVVTNLLTNAVKFTPRGGRVSVRLERHGDSACIEVADTGKGISPDFLPHVFERFRQADSTHARAAGGLGLGLAIVHHLVEQHGGTVVAGSRGEDRGATFTVTLPLLPASARAVDRRFAASARAQGPAELTGVRVLAVDDDPDAREVLETVLAASGADYRVVHSARAAVDELDRFRPEVLLADIGMPEEDGYALIRRVRERESRNGGHLPAVALTAFASAADRATALTLGFEAHLAKPASPAELTRAVAALVRRAE